MCIRGRVGLGRRESLKLTIDTQRVRHFQMYVVRVRTYLVREAELSSDGGEVGRHEALVGEQQHHHHGEQNQREVSGAAFSSTDTHSSSTAAAAAQQQQQQQKQQQRWRAFFFKPTAL